MANSTSAEGGEAWDKERLTCSICHEYFKDPRILPCNDTFCRKCLQGIYDRNQSISPATKLTFMACPSCDQSINIPQIGVSGFPLDLNIRKKKEEFMNKLLDNVGGKNNNNKNDTKKTYPFSPGSRRHFEAKSPSDEQPLGRNVSSARGGRSSPHGMPAGDGMDFRRSQPPPFSPGTYRRNQMVDVLIRSRRERSPHVSTHTSPSAVPFFASPTSDPTSPEEGPKTFRTFTGSRPSRLIQRRRLHEGSRYKSDPGLQGLGSGQPSEFSPPPTDEPTSPEPLRRDGLSSSSSEGLRSTVTEESPLEADGVRDEVPFAGIHGERRSRSRRHVRFVSEENMHDSVEKSPSDQSSEKSERVSPAIRPTRISGLNAQQSAKPDLKCEKLTDKTEKVTEPVNERLKPSKDSSTKDLGSSGNKGDKSSSPTHHSTRRRFFSSLSSPEPKVTSPTGTKPSDGPQPTTPSPDQGPPSPGAKSPSGRVRKRPTIPASLKPDQSPPSPDRQKFATVSPGDRGKSGSSPDRPRSGSSSSSPTRKFVFPTTNSLPRNHRSSSFTHADKTGKVSVSNSKKQEATEQSSQSKDSVSDKTSHTNGGRSPISGERTSVLTGSKLTSVPDDKPSVLGPAGINKDKANSVHAQQVGTPRGKIDSDKSQKNARNDDGGSSPQNRHFVVDHVDMLNVVTGGSHPQSPEAKDDLLKSPSAPKEQQVDATKSSVNTDARHQCGTSSKSSVDRSTNHTINSGQLPKNDTRIKSEADSGKTASTANSRQSFSRAGANTAHNRTDYGTKLRESQATVDSSEGYKARYISTGNRKVTGGSDKGLSDKGRMSGDSKTGDKFEESFVEVEEITLQSVTVSEAKNSKTLGESGSDVKTPNNNYKPVTTTRSLSPSGNQTSKVKQEENTSENQMKFMREVEEVTRGDEVIQQQSQDGGIAGSSSGNTSQESSVNGGEHPSSKGPAQRVTGISASGVKRDSKAFVTDTAPEVHDDKRNGHVHRGMVNSESRSTEEVNSASPEGLNHVNVAEDVHEEIKPEGTPESASKKRSIPVHKAPKAESSAEDMTKVPKEPEPSTTSESKPCPTTSEASEPEVNHEEGVAEDEVEMTPENPIYTSDSVWQMEKMDYEMPTSVVVLSNGNTVVAEFNSGVIQYFDESGKFLYDTSGMKPFCIATNEADHVIVADRKTKSIRIFDEYGSDVTQWKNDCFKWISGVACTSNGRFVIYDRDKYKVGIYDQAGEKVSEFGSYGERDTQLCMADFLAVDSQDRIILCDSGNHCIKVFDSQGGFIRKFGTRGHGNGQMEWPKGICCDSQDNIIVADNRNNRVSLYSAEGEFIQHLVRDFPNPFGVFLSKSNLLGVTHYSLGGASQLAVFKLNDIAGDT